MIKWIIAILIICIGFVSSNIEPDCNPIEVCDDNDCKTYDFYFDGYKCSIKTETQVKDKDIEIKPVDSIICDDNYKVINYEDNSKQTTIRAHYVEDGECKMINEVEDLTPFLEEGRFIINYERDDGIHDLEIAFLNLTAIELKPYIKDAKELNKDIPIKVNGMEKTTIKLLSIDKESSPTIPFTSDNIFDDNYTFGEYSTEITINSNDTGKEFEDTYLSGGAGEQDNNYGATTELLLFQSRNETILVRYGMLNDLFANTTITNATWFVKNQVAVVQANHTGYLMMSNWTEGDNNSALGVPNWNYNYTGESWGPLNGTSVPDVGGSWLFTLDINETDETYNPINLSVEAFTEMVDNPTTVFGWMIHEHYTETGSISFYSSESTGNEHYLVVESANPCNATITLDGLEEDRKYEYQTTANITVIGNASNCTVWLGLDAPDYGFNFSKGDPIANISYIIGEVNTKNFTNSTGNHTLEFITFTSSPHDINISINPNATTNEFRINFSGVDSSGHPSDILIDVSDDGTIDAVLPGNLTNNTLYQGFFTNGENTEVLFYGGAGSITRRMNLSGLVLTSDVQVQNGTINLSVGTSNPGNLSFNEYFHNDSLADNGTNSTPQWVWEDFSLGDITGRWTGSYDVTTGVSIADTSTTEVFCSTGTSTDSGVFASQTLDFTEYGSVFLNVTLQASSTARFANIGEQCPEAFSKAQLRIKDLTLGTTDLVKSISSGTACCGQCCRTSDPKSVASIWEFRVIKNKIEAYDNEAFEISFDYDSTHQYEVEIYTTSTSVGTTCLREYCACEGADDCGGASSGTGTIHEVNLTGITGEQLGNFTFANATYESHEIKTFTSNISSAIINWTQNKPTGTEIEAWLSADNGTNWESVQRGILHSFTIEGANLKYRFFVTGTNTSDTDGDLSEQAIVKSVNLQVLQGYPANISIDIGNDGILEWNNTGAMVENQSIVANWSSESVTDYITDNCFGALSCAVPIAFGTDIAGTLNYENLNQNTTLNTIFFTNQSLFNRINSDLVFNNTIIMRVWSRLQGILEFADLDLRYIGNENVTVTATTGFETTSRVISIRYSLFNVSLPEHIKGINFRITNQTQLNATPYGQEINYLNQSNISQGFNESSSIPIFNFSNLAQLDPINITIRINNTLPACFKFKCNDKVNLSGFVSINTTDQIIIGSGKLNTSVTTEGECYQETANISTSCGGLDTGTYFITGNWGAIDNSVDLYDGSWTTFSRAQNNHSNIYINYTKPDKALNSSVWEVKGGGNIGAPTSNYTIPSNCWNQTPLQFNITSDSNSSIGGVRSIYMECWNGSNYININTTNYSGASYYVYEEAIIWNLTETSKIITGGLGGVWCWADSNDCNATDIRSVRLIPRFDALCEDCVFPTDINNYTTGF